MIDSFQTFATSLTAHAGLKILIAVGLTVGFFGPYAYLQHHHLYAPIVMPGLAIDRLIPFRPSWIIVYLTLWPYLSIAAWMTGERTRLIDYGLRMSALCAVGLVCFTLVPTAIDRLSPVGVQNSIYRAVISIDGSANAMPSLHAAFAIFAALYNDQWRRLAGWPRGLSVANWLWCAAILYATLATKQHVIVDTFGGVALGLVTWRCGRGGVS